MNKNRKTLLGLILVALVAVAGYFVWKSSQEKNSEEKEIVKIGVILPLTGNNATTGVAIKEGMELRMEEYVMHENTRDIELIFEDSRAIPSIGKNALLKLHQQGVKLILGPASSAVASALLPDLSRYKITLFSPSASKYTLSREDEDGYFIRNELSEDIGSKLQAELVFKLLKWRRISIMYSNDEYGIEVKNNFQESFSSLGGNVINVIGFQSNDQLNFDPIVNRLINDDSQALFIVASNEHQYTNIIRSIRTQGSRKEILATPMFETLKNITGLGTMAEGILYAFYGDFNPDNRGREQDRFITSYVKKYKKMPSNYAALGYENLDLTLYGLSLNDYQVDRLRETLIKMNGYRGLTGEISFDQKGNVVKPVLLKKVENGKFVFY